MKLKKPEKQVKKSNKDDIADFEKTVIERRVLSKIQKYLNANKKSINRTKCKV